MALDTKKEVEKVKLSVKKATGADGISMQVKLLADVSGSFKDEFDSGLVNPFFEAAACIASAIDPDKVVQIIAFGDSARDTGDYAIENIGSIVPDFLGRVPRNVLWSGTNYAGALEALIESNSATSLPAAPKKTGGLFSGLFGKKEEPAIAVDTPSDKPWLALFLSDGEDYGNYNKFSQKLSELATSGVFTVLIGANSDQSVKFSALVSAADSINGVTFHRISDLSGCSTDELYSRIFDAEFAGWYKNYVANKAIAA